MANKKWPYKNIPVREDVYERVQLVADANGRGLGDQVAHMVARELPECDHPKQPVEIEYFPSADLPGGALRIRTAFYCPICQRVYASVADPEAAFGINRCDGGEQS